MGEPAAKARSKAATIGRAFQLVIVTIEEAVRALPVLGT
jgi:hypothetical protein